MKSCCKKAVKSFWCELLDELDCEGSELASWGNYGEIISIVCKHTGDELPQWRKDEISKVKR